MWNSWCFRTKIEKDENEKVNEQLNDNFFIDCDVILNVAIVRFERFDEMIVSKNVSNSNIWFRDVAKKIDETNCEISEQVIVDFFAILYANSNAKIKKSKFLTNLRAWFWRKCSWSLLLKLKFCLQRLQIWTHATRWNDALFVNFDLILNVKDEWFELFNKEIVLNDIANSNMNFWDFANETENLCEANDVFSISHIKLIALIER